MDAGPTSAELLLLIVHLAVTAYLTGLVWFVQVVHYPLFEEVDRARFPAFAARHARRTTWVAGPAMLLEAGCALWLLVARPAGLPAWQPATGAALLAVVWLSTFALQVPRHRDLARGFDPAAHRRLVATNWLRTAAWTLRALLAVAMAGAAR